MFVPGTTSRPPADLAIPHNEQLIATALTCVPVVYFLGVIFKALARGDPTPFWFIVGGTVASAFEPIVDVMGFCFFPREGNWIAFEFFGRPIPYFVPPCYAWFVGGQAYWFFTIISQKETTRPDVWKLWIKSFSANLLLEYPAMALGMYTYYGHQPINIAGFPLWFPAIHATSPIMSAITVYLVRPHLVGFKSWIIGAIVCCTYGMANCGLGWPVWCALSMDRGPVVSNIAALMTAILIATTIWLLSLAIPDKTQGKLQNGSASKRL
ncbi:hypothetical protein IQ07DRAFT_587007 [Pyrenochaeta sp. DS3sAY3a]|nr:hypothetical protein IQ07DRAFT_587007 [Pyrenochaeta sp. DS3sAY3a]